MREGDGTGTLGELAEKQKAERRKADKSLPANLHCDDFYAYMVEHRYIFTTTGQIWPASSVNARVPPVQIGTDDSGEPVKIPASVWLDRNRPVEQMTWVPGNPTEIKDKLIVEGGWIPQPGRRVFNLYRPAIIVPTPGNVDRWVAHIDRLYGVNGDHIIRWCASRTQHPDIKINHALVLGGKQGIGKDSLLEPVKRAVGAWNCSEVSPKQVLGRFNGFLKSVILRVSEGRDLGEFDRFAFYDHMKSIIAAPPDVLRVDEKHRAEYAIPNTTGVVITTNHKSDGIYLPADDRRHFVAWCDLDKLDFDEDYWDDLWRFYESGGDRAVAHYLHDFNLSGFNPKAPPPQTDAFFEIVNSSRAPEDAELADALDLLKWPAVVTASDVTGVSQQADFIDWLKDRRNARRVPHRFEACGYTPVRNPDADDGLWRIKARRQVVYGRTTLNFHDRLRAAREL